MAPATENIPFVDDATALESMRHSDFDVYSAYGEVIDNSIQASAKNIRISIKYTPEKSRRAEPIQSITFGDDGTGMEPDILHSCLRLGYSSRYNDRTGIGRFGVGLTLAAIHECKKVEVYSKTQNGPWKYTYIDLDEIGGPSPTLKGIPKPYDKTPAKEQVALAGKISGTIVIWSKYDAPSGTPNASEVIEEAKIWIGRTYRKYIWDGATIILNQAEVFAIDPLYARTDKTQFPNDPKAREFNSITLPWPIAESTADVPIDSERYGITIRLSILPETWRPNKGSGNSNETKERYINRNEGISIMRKGREVFYDRVPHWPGARWEEIDRWWGCEVSFDPILDREFTVKTIKRGAIPIKALKQALCNQIDQTRKFALEQVRELWATNDKLKQDADRDGKPNPHKPAEVAAGNTTQPKSPTNTAQNIDEDAKKLADTISKTADARQRAEWESRFKAQPFSIVDNSWAGPEFLQTHQLGGHAVLSYNARHVFFQELDAIQQNLSALQIDQGPAKRLQALIDLLLLSYSKAQAMTDEGSIQSVSSLLEQLRMDWGNYLRNYIETYRKEHPGE